MKRRYLVALALTLTVLIPDLITKAVVQAKLELWESRTVIPGFLDLVHVTNKGAAFGFLNRVDITWQTAFLVAVTLLAVGVMVHLLRQASDQETFLVAGLGLILGGALGNLVDRLRYGEVVDFLDFYVGDWHWPAFNVADIAITLGAFCLLISLYRKKPHASRSR
ncbi:signal peptidase II [Desulfovibrio aminophilus]|nr:signal peptidase II [Desulfovibrio aminophilus]MCM0754455.1 signal peptidase II [Desulfovibrio aminophilus]